MVCSSSRVAITRACWQSRRLIGPSSRTAKPTTSPGRIIFRYFHQWKASASPCSRTLLWISRFVADALTSDILGSSGEGSIQRSPVFHPVVSLVPSRKVIQIARPAMLDPQIAPDGPAKFFQTLQECSDAGFRFRVVGGQIDRVHPILRTPPCCPRAVSGHAAVPPSSVMNWRRFVRLDCICCPARPPCIISDW